MKNNGINRKLYFYFYDLNIIVKFCSIKHAANYYWNKKLDYVLLIIGC